AFALAGPQIVRWLGRPARRAGRRFLRLPAYLALDNIVKFPTRTSLTTIAFGGSLALIIGIGGTVKSLDHGLSTWMDSVFVFDLTISTGDLSVSAYTSGSIPSQLLDEVRHTPQAAEV